MTEPVLTLERVSKSFGGLHVTRNVSLTAQAGEVHALIGPNGAGKTTLISQIAGTLKPDIGDIRLEGRSVTGLGVAARARLGLARLFQISSVIASFTALENVALSAPFPGQASFWRPLSRERAQMEAARATLDSVGLGARAQIPAGQLSYGEKRALELAMCLVQRPRLLLLDEPMAGVGPQETEALTRLLLSLKGRIAILLIEHDMQTVFSLADRISLLVGGAVEASGGPEEMRHDPAVRRAYLGGEAS